VAVKGGKMVCLRMFASSVEGRSDKSSRYKNPVCIYLREASLRAVLSLEPEIEILVRRRITEI